MEHLRILGLILQHFVEWVKLHNLRHLLLWPNLLLNSQVRQRLLNQCLRWVLLYFRFFLVLIRLFADTEEQLLDFLSLT